VPSRASVLIPWVLPKFEPFTVTTLPTVVVLGDKDVMAGRKTVKVCVLLLTPSTVTRTDPVNAEVGTVNWMLVSLQELGVMALPPRVSVLLPWVAPKFDPLTVTTWPIFAVLGDKLVIEGVGGAKTANVLVLLVAPPTVTDTVFDDPPIPGGGPGITN
jgi:hypothetical protein